MLSSTLCLDRSVDACGLFYVFIILSSCQRFVRFGESVLLLAPAGQNRPSSVCRGPYKIVGRLENDEYRVEISPGKAETYHV